MVAPFFYVFNILLARFTYTAYHYFHVMHGVARWQGDDGYIRFFEALCAAAFFATEMYVMIVMFMLPAIGFADSIPYTGISSGDFMNDPLIEECLQGTVNGNPVKAFAAELFEVGMFECAVTFQKELQYLHTGICDAQIAGT